ncbi:hypothetical protein RD1_3707 [Roseobacter denitrificans OCh 114]|uniref:Uncharacterized protein n=1 Tax=Roseobacter denitrificans (strain ATCC 33942 / OCh 114) TaxID=375451 RepID=Q162B4_ROSDO|nr:hypothetical protein RD1_3707 [Roseobacter denitrificans OCh 114]
MIQRIEVFGFRRRRVFQVLAYRFLHMVPLIALQSGVTAACEPRPWELLKTAQIYV